MLTPVCFESTLEWWVLSFYYIINIKTDHHHHFELLEILIVEIYPMHSNSLERTDVLYGGNIW